MAKDEIGNFWVVTTPTEVSELGDILFEADIPYLYNQFRGGLKIEEIEGLFQYKDKVHAEKFAQSLLLKQRREPE